MDMIRSPERICVGRMNTLHDPRTRPHLAFELTLLDLRLRTAGQP